LRSWFWLEFGDDDMTGTAGRAGGGVGTNGGGGGADTAGAGPSSEGSEFELGEPPTGAVTGAVGAVVSPLAVRCTTAGTALSGIPSVGVAALGTLVVGASTSDG
jgi:hypothetical protein